MYSIVEECFLANYSLFLIDFTYSLSILQGVALGFMLIVKLKKE